MKLPVWSCFLVACIFSSFSSATLFQSSVAFQCTGICLEGSPVAWNMTVRNVDNETVALKQFSLTDAEGLVFAQWGVFPEKTINPSNILFLTSASLVPPPTRGSTLYYRACFDFGKGVECENGWRTLVVMPLSAVQCVDNKECPLQSVCQAYRCQPMVCPLGSTPDDHECSFTPSIVGIAALAAVVGLIVWRRHK